MIAVVFGVRVYFLEKDLLKISGLYPSSKVIGVYYTIDNKYLKLRVWWAIGATYFQLYFYLILVVI